MTIDAIATNPTVAQAILDAGGDYVLALKCNQPTLHDEVARYFADPAAIGIETVEATDKDHGRIETRRTSVCHDTSWLTGDRRYPDEPRLPNIQTIVMTTTQTERRGKITDETRYFVASARLGPERAAHAIRAHWGIESLHWVLDVVFKEDLSRLRRGHGAPNMAHIRRFAFNIVRAGRGTKSIKTARKAAAWSQDFLASLILPQTR